MNQINEDPMRDVEVKYAEGGLAYGVMDQSASMRCIDALINEERRQDILGDIADRHMPIVLELAKDVPAEFEDMLGIVPNRDQSHTVGQPLALMHSRSCGDAIQRRLTSKTTLQDLADAACEDPVVGQFMTHFREAVVRDGQFANISDISMFNASLAQYAGEHSRLDDLVDEMDGITHEMDHMQYTWSDDTRGTAVLVPEARILHRRMGRDTAQVVWHTDTTRGSILFCLLEGQDFPHRTLFTNSAEQQF